MNATHPSSEYPFLDGDALSFRPVGFAQFHRGWVVEVRATDLVPLAASVDSARRLGAKRGYLANSEVNRGLAEMLSNRPADFGFVGQIVLGADAVELVPGPGAFSDRIHVIGPECIEGFQRLRTISDAAGCLPAVNLEQAVLQVAIFCGRERRRARILYDEADRYLNPSTAQDGLVRCPHLRRLMDADWERCSFDPRRGITTGPQGERFTMDEVTRALACLSDRPVPEAANLAATEEGRQALWSRIDSPLYGQLFHEGVTPLGVVRAVDAWNQARETLIALPARLKQGHGHLIRYAPALICWLACRRLPLFSLHEGDYHWDEAISLRLPAATEAAAELLVSRYRALRPGSRQFKPEAPTMGLWLELLEGLPPQPPL
ncbi:hypothetical protein [Streptomyces lavendulae]|uniref:hypothetical protein n=1 Tax=Streptomyces lavendulae TaxID=1914 RepID=UPI0024A28344|nr:hypothetical protein [Streptomyces lavendulae]GLX20698.1 hypothetical protein Slala01_43420 [Streptomyces lavendulae subsp. lavendulae]GLX28140.1 hypothetical protein Slala02_39600 [Streptomyces lavendulae subsp. lavendulae]